jgi:hypothetical protein
VLLLVEQTEVAAAAVPLWSCAPGCSACLLHPLPAVHAEQAALSSSTLLQLGRLQWYLLLLPLLFQTCRLQAGTVSLSEATREHSQASNSPEAYNARAVNVQGVPES